MPKIDFYVIAEANPQGCLDFICRLVEKAYRNRHHIYIHTENKTDAHQLDEMLWTYREDSFLPHHLYGEGPEPAPPIQIGFNVIPEKHQDILINLAADVPEFYPRFNRVLQVVPNDTTAQARARDHYRIYRAAGYDITTHKLQTADS